MSSLYKTFKNPPAALRGKPFWSWNGKLDKEELLHQSDILSEMGFGGYFMHSRTGLITEYLGDEWFDLVNALADKSAPEGAEVYLYDEDRWPSGTAGGMVTKNPEYGIHYIRLSMAKGEAYEFSGEEIAVFACDMLPEKHQFAFENDTPITKDTPRSAYANKTVLSFTIEPMASDSFYNGFNYLDTMNPEAVGKFIELTHEKYAEKCGDRIGTSIKGVFTDEPHRGAVMCGFCLKNEDPLYLTPYTPRLFDAFRERFGYDLKEKLPDLFLLRGGEPIHAVKWHYMDLLEDLFIDAFAKPVGKWCKDHNMILTGHILHEDSLTAQACMVGSVMRFYEHMDYPGVDVLTEYNRNYWIVKQLSSAARQNGQKYLLSELYGCTGWQMDFESHKWIGDWQALFGINVRCPHLSWYTMEGEAKRDYPASINKQSAWYKDYSVVEDYYSRLHAVLGGEPVCDVLVMNPVESVFAMIYPGWSHSLGTNHPRVAELESMYAQQFLWLCDAKLDFDYGDEEMMSRMAKVEVKDGVQVLTVGKMSYKTVIVSGADTIRSSTLKLFTEFAEKGGKVIVAGFAPAYVDAEKSDAFVEAQSAFITVPFECGALIKELKKHVSTVVSVKDARGNELPGVFCQVRAHEDGVFAVIMNMNKDDSFYGCTVTLSLEGDCEEWDAKTGDIAYIASSENGKITVTTDFPAAGEHVYCVKKKSDAASKKQLIPHYCSPMAEQYTIGLSEPNVCVLDMASFEVDGEKQGTDEILRVDQRVRDRFGVPRRGGEMLQPWFTGLTEHKTLGHVALEFEFFAEYIPEEFELVCERPELWHITVNGTEVTKEQYSGKWVDICFDKFRLSGDVLVQGRNAVRMEADFSEPMNIEAVYLLGRFCVTLEDTKRVLTPFKTNIYHGDIVKSGFPFYGGAITYETAITGPHAPDERIFIEFPDFEAALVRISANDKKPVDIAWQPYRADITDLLNVRSNILKIEYVLTRRNTFGPLHCLPPRRGSYGPDTFITEGDTFTYDYVLLPQGMTAVPKIIRKIEKK